MKEAESVIYCEGFLDRDFLAGAVERAGWTTHKGRSDPWGKSIEPGVFGFARGDHYLSIRECKGDTNVLPRMIDRLSSHAVKPLRSVVAVLDSDCALHESDPGVRRCDEFAGHMTSKFPQATRSSPSHYVVHGDVNARLIVWRGSTSVDQPGLPRQHDLERLICESLLAVAEQRGGAVDAFLRAEPLGGTGSKEHAYSYLAKWYADGGAPESFYRRLWNDVVVATELARRLEHAGVLAVLEDL